MSGSTHLSSSFFFNDTATTEIYTLSLHDALPISHRQRPGANQTHLTLEDVDELGKLVYAPASQEDRKSTRLNSSHANISYAVFCLKKKTPLRSSSRYSSLRSACCSRSHLSGSSVP